MSNDIDHRMSDIKEILTFQWYIVGVDILTNCYEIDE